MTAGKDPADISPAGPALTQRLDKWLWFARVLKSRTMAAAAITAGKIRVNKTKIDKPSHAVRAGDVVTSSHKATVRILRVVAIGNRRGPATEAARLYEDLTPAPVPNAALGVGQGKDQSGRRTPGAGRPTKRERRDLDRLHGRD